MRSRCFVVHFSSVLSLAMRISAQTQMAQCLPPWEWNQNSLGQDPCTVGSILDAYCRGQPEYIYPPLEDGSIYSPPAENRTGDMDCDCNTVMYSLNMACMTCQGVIAYGWVIWKAACGSVDIAGYPGDIPQGTRVPHWAFYDVTLSGQKYDDGNAENIGRDPEATPSQVSTSTSSTGPSATGTANNVGSSGGKNTAAIVGGVVGGVGVLVITLIGVFFVLRYSRRKREKNSPPSYQRQGVPVNHWKNRPNSSAYDPSVSTGPSVGPNVPLQPYNPANPLTFPPPMPWGRTNQFPHQPPVTYVTPISNYGARR